MTLAGKKALVTAGGTREAIDAVRFIGNKSSGKQGYAIAEEAFERGADVTLVATVVREMSDGIDRLLVESAAEMREAVVGCAGEADIVIMAAAVADFRPSSVRPVKYKKSEGVPTLTLEPTADILAELGQAKSASQVLVGFAAESDNLEANACRKLAEKNADIIVANNIIAADAGFDSDTNEVMIFSWSELASDLAGRTAAETTERPAEQTATETINQLHVPSVSKREVASVLLDVVESHIARLR